MSTKPTNVTFNKFVTFKYAADNAKKVLKSGDRIRVTKCPGTRRTITFAGWDGDWIVSKSGMNDYSANTIDRLNGKPVDFVMGTPSEEFVVLLSVAWRNIMRRRAKKEGIF